MGVQVGSDGKVRVKNDGVVVASEGDPCCCEAPTLCDSYGDCCFSSNSKANFSWSGLVEGGDPLYPPPGGGSGTAVLLRDALLGNPIWRSEIDDNWEARIFWVTYPPGYSVVIHRISPGNTGVSSGTIDSENCCGASGDFQGSNWALEKGGTWSFTVSNNKCCRCDGEGGLCLETSDGSVSACDGAGINTCDANQDDDCAMP